MSAEVMSFVASELPTATVDPATLPVTQRAANALKARETEQQLVELVKQSAGIVTITNAAGLAECHAARMRLKVERVSIEKLGKGARDDANAFAKAVIAEERRLVGLIEGEEARLGKLQDAWTAAREAEKEEARRKEADRVRAIEEAVDSIKARPLDAAGKSSMEIAAMIDDLEALPIGESFAEQKDRAELAKSMALSKLRRAAEDAGNREAEALQLAAERAELERQRAEQAERDRLERAELDRQREVQRAEQARLDAEDKARRQQLEADDRARRERDSRERDRRAYIDTIRQIATQLLTAAAPPTSDDIAASLASAGCLVVVETDFTEFPGLYDEARHALADTIARLQGMLQQAKKREAEEARLRMEREQLERDQAEQRRQDEERDRAARAEQERIEREAREKADAEARAKADAEQRERDAREAAERKEREQRETAERNERYRLALIEDGRAHLQTFVRVYGEVEQYAGMARAIAAFLTAEDAVTVNASKPVGLAAVAKPKRVRRAA